MNLVITMLIGLGIGTMVELLLPGHSKSELVLAVLLGIAGAVLARLVGERGGWFTKADPASFVGSALGAIVVLLVYGALFRRRHRL